MPQTPSAPAGGSNPGACLSGKLIFRKMLLLLFQLSHYQLLINQTIFATMSLENYLVRSHEPAVEIRNAFGKEEIEQLYNLVKEIGYKQYGHFFVENIQEIVKYISLTPSRRAQKKWVNSPNILLIRLAALQISLSTVSLTNDIVPITKIVDRGSYRDFHSVVAASVALLLKKQPLFSFPFDGWENPFSKEP